MWKYGRFPLLAMALPLLSGCALGPWQRERVETSVRYEERPPILDGGRWEATVTRRDNQLKVHLVQPIRCVVNGDAIRTEHAFEHRQYNAWIAVDGIILVGALMYPFLRGQQRSDLPGEDLVGLTFAALPAAIVLTVELLRSKHRETYRELEPEPYSYTRRCPSRVGSGAVVQVLLPDGTTKRVRADEAGVARFEIEPGATVTVRVGGLKDQLSRPTSAR